MTLNQIIHRSKRKQPYFFSKETLEYFGQKEKDFSVEEQDDGRYKISAPIIDHRGDVVGETVRFFNPDTDNLDIE